MLGLLYDPKRPDNATEPELGVDWAGSAAAGPARWAMMCR